MRAIALVVDRAGFELDPMRDRPIALLDAAFADGRRARHGARINPVAEDAPMTDRSPEVAR